MAFAHTFSHFFGLHHGAERMRFAGRTDVSLVREFFQIHGVPESVENFRQFFDNYVFWLEHIIAQSTGGECAGIRRFVTDLLALPQPPLLGLLTGNIRLGAEIKLRRFDLWDYFVMGGFADDHEDRNHIAVAALQRGRRVLDPHLQPQEIVVIGDTPFDVRCGKFIGAKTLAVATGGSSYAELKPHGADWTVENLGQIPAREVCPR
jgi:phosphoglycolate phosphatase-like HAD superfamily hydrolase